VQQRHRFCRGSRFVQQRCCRDFHRRQIANHRLKIQERFEAPLGNLGLIGRVRRVPRGVLEQISQDDARCNCSVVPHPDERLETLILAGDGPQPLEVFVLGLCWRQLQWPFQPDAARQGGVDERLERRHAHHTEHGGELFVVGTDVALFELVGYLDGH
jgi:hypothetical protein